MSKTIDWNVIYNFIGLENGYENEYENGYANGYEKGYENRHENGYTNGFDHNGNSNVSQEEYEDEQLSGKGKKRPRCCADFVFFFIAYKFYYFLSGFTEIIDDDSDVRPVISLASHCSAKSLFKELLFRELIAWKNDLFLNILVILIIFLTTLIKKPTAKRNNSVPQMKMKKAKIRNQI